MGPSNKAMCQKGHWLCGVAETDARCRQTTGEARRAGRATSAQFLPGLPPTFSHRNKKGIRACLNFAWLTIGVPTLSRPAGATLITENDIFCQSLLWERKSTCGRQWGEPMLNRGSTGGAVCTSASSLQYIFLLYDQDCCFLFVTINVPVWGCFLGAQDGKIEIFQDIFVQVFVVKKKLHQ